MTVSLEKGPRIQSAIRRDDTILRLGGDGCGYSMTWTADDKQLVAVFDGAGWPEGPSQRYYSSRLFAISGSPQNAAFHDVPSYPDILLWDYLQGSAPYYGLNIFAVDGRTYQFLSTEDNLGFSWIDKSTWTNFNSAKLIYSPDNDRTWCNQDGSTPVIRESRRTQSRKNMVFFHEPQDAFSQLSFLQMGRDYQCNRDGYVYVYAPNGTAEGTMNELVMFRVSKTQILERGAYEFFGGLRVDGNPYWVKDINARGVVYTFPRGWVSTVWPLAWQPSVVYNAPLGVYMMANCSGIGADCVASKPSYLGFWIALNPWGPWRQIYEETVWTPAGDSGARAASPQIAPKWIAEDGKSFWFVWTDAQQSTSVDRNESRFHTQSHNEWTQGRSRWREDHPHFAFNTQRVDLMVM
jgi:hypothetical protein